MQSPDHSIYFWIVPWFNAQKFCFFLISDQNLPVNCKPLLQVITLWTQYFALAHVSAIASGIGIAFGHLMNLSTTVNKY